MAFASFDRGAPHAPMVEINMIPLVDVMLVLLVIFIITAPLLTHSLKIDLPRASTSPSDTGPAQVSLAIDAAGRYYWDGRPVTKDEVATRARAAAEMKPQPELRLSADKTTPYQKLAQIMAVVAKAGLSRIGFVSDPHDEEGGRR